MGGYIGRSVLRTFLLCSDKVKKGKLLTILSNRNPEELMTVLLDQFTIKCQIFKSRIFYLPVV